MSEKQIFNRNYVWQLGFIIIIIIKKDQNEMYKI